MASHLLSRPELSRCSPKSQPKTRSFRMPDCFSLRLDGRDNMKLLLKIKTQENVKMNQCSTITSRSTDQSIDTAQKAGAS